MYFRVDVYKRQVRPKEELVGRTGMALVANQLKTYAKTTNVEDVYKRQLQCILRKIK